MGQLQTIDFNQLPATQAGSNDTFDEMSKSQEYLGRIQLYGTNREVKAGLVGTGCFGIPESKEEVTDLGKSIDVYVLARRPKAIDYGDREAIIETFDPTSAEFQRIAEESKEKDSSCMYGPSLLLFERSTGRFVEFFCASKSARSSAKNLYAYLPLTAADIKARGLKGEEPRGPIAATLKSRLIVKPDFSWFVFDVSKCSTPFTNLPDIAEVSRQMTDFVNATGKTVEKVEEPENKKRRAR